MEVKMKKNKIGDVIIVKVSIAAIDKMEIIHVLMQDLKITIKLMIRTLWFLMKAIQLNARIYEVENMA